MAEFMLISAKNNFSKPIGSFYPLTLRCSHFIWLFTLYKVWDTAWLGGTILSPAAFMSQRCKELHVAWGTEEFGLFSLFQIYITVVNIKVCCFSGVYKALRADMTLH